MTDEATTESPTPAAAPDTGRDRRLYRALAWVGITAGVVFTVAVIFFSGLLLGRASGGYHGWHRGYQGWHHGPWAGQMAPGGCPMMDHGGPGGPGRMMDPDARPGKPPASPAPAQR